MPDIESAVDVNTIPGGNSPMAALNAHSGAYRYRSAIGHFNNSLYDTSISGDVYAGFVPNSLAAPNIEAVIRDEALTSVDRQQMPSGMPSLSINENTASDADTLSALVYLSEAKNSADVTSTETTSVHNRINDAQMASHQFGSYMPGKDSVNYLVPMVPYQVPTPHHYFSYTSMHPMHMPQHPMSIVGMYYPPHVPLRIPYYVDNSMGGLHQKVKRDHDDAMLDYSRQPECSMFPEEFHKEFKKRRHSSSGQISSQTSDQYVESTSSGALHISSPVGNDHQPSSMKSGRNTRNESTRGHYEESKTSTRHSPFTVLYSAPPGLVTGRKISKGQFPSKTYEPGMSKYSCIYMNSHRWAVCIKSGKRRFRTRLEADACFESLCRSDKVDPSTRWRPGWTVDMDEAYRQELLEEAKIQHAGTQVIELMNGDIVPLVPDASESSVDEESTPGVIGSVSPDRPELHINDDGFEISSSTNSAQETLSHVANSLDSVGSGGSYAFSSDGTRILKSQPLVRRHVTASPPFIQTRSRKEKGTPSSFTPSRISLESSNFVVVTPDE